MRTRLPNADTAEHSILRRLSGGQQGHKTPAEGRTLWTQDAVNGRTIKTQDADTTEHSTPSKPGHEGRSMPSKTRRQWIVGGRIDDGDDDDDEDDDDDNGNGILSWVMARVLIESRESTVV